jgi:hypothetical protein
MKKLIYLIFALSLLLATSCKTSQKQNDTTPSPNNLIQKDSTSDATGYTDTLDLCDKKYLYTSISKVEFSSFYKDSKKRAKITKGSSNSFKSAKLIEDYLLSQDTFARREGDTLVIRLNNDKEAMFIDSLDYQYYIFDGLRDGGDFCQLLIHFYEGYLFGLVNLNTGQLTYLWGKPKFDDSREWIVAMNVDLEAGYSPTGFQIFNHVGDSLIKTFQCQTDDWGPVNIDWISPDRINMERTFLKFGGDSLYYESDYIELSLNAL